METDQRIKTALDALKSKRRREILQIVSSEGETTIEDVCEKLSGDREKLEISLIHNHIPKLEESNIIKKKENKITKGTRFERAEETMEGVLEIYL